MFQIVVGDEAGIEIRLNLQEPGDASRSARDDVITGQEYVSRGGRRSKTRYARVVDRGRKLYRKALPDFGITADHLLDAGEWKDAQGARRPSCIPESASSAYASVAELAMFSSGTLQLEEDPSFPEVDCG